MLTPDPQLELSSFLIQQPVNIGWCSVFLQTVSKALPASVMAEQLPVERETHHWCKAKKWAYFNLNRLFIR